ncbi:arylalkylamine N-acetyltransferase-like 2 [Drosophila albomicans]|uniref:aralkylamine N-acetyltransferase n=1 Tax=Drosophila albomicans TaxID=7291 RepID=A0A6P8WK79_DROAB|nr:arylalkylamine N-acetyltransferase-like 2 [Drosophila albomicans]
MSTNFATKDGILIRVMTKEDFKKIEESIYDEEPLRSGLEDDTKAEVQLALIEGLENYHNSLIEQGNCLVAINENDGGRIVGSVLAGCETYSNLQKNLALVAALDDGTFKRIATFEFETKIKVNYFERFGVSRVLLSHMTNVDASVRGKGLGTRLTAALIELGRIQGFPIMIAFCTSFYSARQKKALGMECIYTQAYQDYRDANGEAVFKPPAPHTHTRILATKL